MSNQNLLVSNFPFETDINDKCGNSWNVNGSPVIKDCSSTVDFKGKKLFNKACYFNGSSCIYKDSAFTFGGKSFTISLWFYKEGTGNQNVLNIKNLYDFYGTTSFSPIGGTFELNKWNHIARVYDHQNSKFYAYLNGNLINSGSESLTATARNVDIAADNRSYFFLGYIKHFQLYLGLAIWKGNTINLEETCEEYIQYRYVTTNSNSILFHCIQEDTNNNTRRTTKWNQKANYVVLGPKTFYK